MKINQCFPGILERRYPTVEAGYSLLTVLYLLRMKDIDAVPISPLTPKRARGVFGYTTLPRMLKMRPEEFAGFLDGPCEKASSELAVLGFDEDVDDLLAAFDSKKRGFAVVHDGGRPPRASLVTLADFLRLHARGVLRTNQTAEQVASQFAGMRGSTSIRDALEAMLAQGHRRIFISGKKTYVSDRSIMHYVFDPMVLEDVSAIEDVLSGPIDSITQLTPGRVKLTSKLQEAAKALLNDRGGCLTPGDGTVVTPWDVVIKPWRAGTLRWAET